ncbi:hypothetical protein IPC1162_07785 [Pseudomonas aeruginosa]|nr:hypothetical protein HV96_30360 [Pseudomonas aeruginosa]OHP40438.1 hypothetical protein HMPREF2535_00015 [Pseudomonas sp. HMSC060F12]AOT37595.1 hypothetical protein BHE76_10125 [Pseudomonas aeruginosa]AXC21258.1 hypothetical protein CWE28_14950 [Pseudomonas aeruginosa]KSF17073.1 hypothetical protein AO929_18025 [Pseudomonas aeruginosa]
MFNAAFGGGFSKRLINCLKNTRLQRREISYEKSYLLVNTESLRNKAFGKQEIDRNVGSE